MWTKGDFAWGNLSLSKQRKTHVKKGEIYIVKKVLTTLRTFVLGVQ